MPTKKPTLKFSPNQKTCQLSPLHVHNHEKKQQYIHYLLDLLNSDTEFELNWIRMQHFQIKLCDIAVSLKYGHGH